MKYSTKSIEKKVIERIVKIECDEYEYLNGELDKHIKYALRQQADKIVIEIVNTEHK